VQTACDLELWQEAFRSVEDIQGLMALGKKTPKPQLMAIYYARLTRIFTVSGSHLYNGYAWCALPSRAMLVSFMSHPSALILYIC
jgi:translation initiation factor 3 subunit A